ncbi:hypothetical protein RUM44_000118, partial [Polyplax serrata]
SNKMVTMGETTMKGRWSISTERQNSPTRKKKGDQEVEERKVNLTKRTEVEKENLN